EVLEERGVVATLFCTVRFATAWSDLIRAAVVRHELGSHGWAHGRLEEGDVRRSREALEERFGVAVEGFRPARFQAVRTEVVREAGYRYQSSENPIWLPGRYNMLGRPRTVYREGGVVQVPISASPGLRLPLFWLAAKNYPESVFRAVAGWTLRRDGYLNLFFHPWEMCDVGRWRLPWVVGRRGGRPMARWLRRQIEWLKERAVFETLGGFTRGWSGEDRG
ncbi:MAG: polysaccharide deacetylase family protein, partial [Verrucomicrobiia bacterium]